MEPPPEPAVRDQIDRICDSHEFRATPKLARLLRFLADKTFEAGDSPVGQRVVAEHVLGPSDRSGPNAGVVIRMQVGRLRRHLDHYYSTVGCHDEIRIEVPKRNYRLRFAPGGALARMVSPRAVERTTLAVVEFSQFGGGSDQGWLPEVLTREMVVALGPFCGVAVRGPVASATVGAGGAGADFILVGDVRGEQAAAEVSLRLLDGRTGLQAWARALSLPLAAADGVPGASRAALLSVADELADETGVIACQGMRASASFPLESLSARGAMLAFWRFLVTGSPDDLIRARAATQAVADAVPDSPIALAAAAMTRMVEYLSDPRPQVGCPREPLSLMERALSLAPGNAWVQVDLGFALWIARETIGLEAICRGLDGRPGSSSFHGVLGSLMTVTAIDLARGEALLADAVARAPQPLYWFCHHLALCGFRRGDLVAMRSALARIVVRTDPFSLVLRMVLLTCEGDLAAARGLSRTILEVLPTFADSGEEMLRRLLHDDHVDAIAAALAPLGLGWFE